MSIEEVIDFLKSKKKLYSQMDESGRKDYVMECLDTAINLLSNKTDGDLISRKALLQKMWNDFYKMEDAHEKEQGFEYIGEKRTLEQNGFECAIKTVSEFPSAEKTAEWVIKKTKQRTNYKTAQTGHCYWLHEQYVCSNCGEKPLVERADDCADEVLSNYCPNCGRRMRGVEE